MEREEWSAKLPRIRQIGLDNCDNIAEDSRMEYTERFPAPPLRDLVRCYWQLEGVGMDSDRADPAFPDGSPELIFNLADPFEHVATDGTITQQPLAFLVGQITRPFLVRPTGRVDLIAVRFEAHGAALLHQHLSQLTDRWIDADGLRDGRLAEVFSRLRRTTTIEARIAILDQTLAELVRQGPLPDPRVASAVREIRDGNGSSATNTPADDAAVVPRTLQRLFARQVGISPKFLARIVRFQRVFAVWRDDPRSLARVAAECGYSDHSHLVRDFRDFAGGPPAGLLAALPEFTKYFTA